MKRFENEKIWNPGKTGWEKKKNHIPGLTSGTGVGGEQRGRTSGKRSTWRTHPRLRMGGPETSETGGRVISRRGRSCEHREESGRQGTRTFGDLPSGKACLPMWGDSLRGTGMGRKKDLRRGGQSLRVDVRKKFW